MKTPISLITTDWHLKETNIPEVTRAVEEELALAGKYGIRDVICLGDVFNSRTSQSQKLLTALENILEKFVAANVNLWCIPGNHDKTDYTADQSFLSVYKYHPNFFLLEKPAKIEMLGCDLYFVPFYQADRWLNEFAGMEEPESGKKSILFSHTAMNGSINNDGSTVENGIKPSMFNAFNKVFLGHYHNQQQISRNIFHLPSLIQDNFGEDEDKGITVLYDDLSTELVRTTFVPYRDICIEASTATRDDINALYQMDTNAVHWRVIVHGDRQAVAGAVNREKLIKQGFAVKVKYSEVELTEAEEESTVLRELTGEDIKEKFKSFCRDRGYDIDRGYKLLKEIMQWQE